LIANERSPDLIIRDLRGQIEALEGVVSSQSCTIDRAVEAERARIIRILSSPSPVLMAALQYSGNGAAWFGEDFLAEYLRPTTYGAEEGARMEIEEFKRDWKPEWEKQ
jgi:hypothetical protein